MGVINSQSLATSRPINLTRGFGFFPANTTLDNPSPPTLIGLGATPTTSHTLLNTQVPLALWRIRGNLSARLVAGVFFGFNLRYTLEGETFADGTAELSVTGDSSQGGAGFGPGVTLSLSLSLERSRTTFTFANGFRTTWERTFNTSQSVNIDLIFITLQLLRRSGINVPLEQIQTARKTVGSGAVWGLFDSASSQFASRGSLTLRPRLSVSGNLLPFIAALAPVVKGLKSAGFKVKVGPALNIQFPVTIQIDRLTTEDGNYRARPMQQDTVLRFDSGPRISPSAPPVQDVSIVHSHTIGLQFSLEIKGSVSLWSIFSAGSTIPINLSGAADPPLRPLGVARLLGPFFTTLNNSDNLAMGGELPEVVWA